jgi:hypothetical protein
MKAFKKTTVILFLVALIALNLSVFTVQARPATPCADQYAARLDAGVDADVAWGGFCACLDYTYGGDNSDCWGL